MQKSSLIGLIVVVVIIIIGGGAWYVSSHPQIEAELGLTHPPAPVATTTPMIQTGMHGGMMRGGFATGSIEVLNDNGFTLTLSDGSTKVVVITATTTLQNFAAASSTPTTITADQLSVGEQVAVQGTPNADGSINARRVSTGVLPTPGARMGSNPGGPRMPRPQAVN